MTNRVCPVCGGDLVGDGYTSVIHCENVESDASLEPDANPVYCDLCEDPLNGLEAEKRRADQIDINFKFLFKCIEEIHDALCPGHIGTWQDRAQEAVRAAKAISLT